MELAVVDSASLQDNHIISVRLGDTRRQAPLEKLRRHALKFPSTTEACAEPLKLDVLQVVASTHLVLRPGEASYNVGFGNAGGPALHLGIRVQNSTPSTAAEPTSARASRNMSAQSICGLAKYQDTAASAREYLEEHGLLRYIQALLHAAIQVRPSDPYDFMLQQLAAAVPGACVTTGAAASPSPKPPLAAGQQQAAAPPEPESVAAKKCEEASNSKQTQLEIPEQQNDLLHKENKMLQAHDPSVEAIRDQLKNALVNASRTGDLDRSFEALQGAPQNEQPAAVPATAKNMLPPAPPALPEVEVLPPHALPIPPAPESEPPPLPVEEAPPPRGQSNEVGVNDSQAGELARTSELVTNNPGEEFAPQKDIARVWSGTGVGHKLGGESSGNLSPAEKRLKALEAAERRKNVPATEKAGEPPSGEVVRADTNALKGLVRNSLEKSFASGALAEAINKVANAPESTVVEPTPGDIAKLRTRGAASTGSESCVPDVAELKHRLKEALSSSCNSGALASALSETLEKRNSNPQKLEGESVRGLAELRTTQFTTRLSAPPGGYDMNALKAHLAGALVSSRCSGALGDVLKNVMSSGEDGIDELKAGLRAKLQASCESGALAGALSEVMGRHGPQELKASLRKTLADSFQSGELDRALSEMRRSSDVEQLKARIQKTLAASFESGELARALSAVVPASTKDGDGAAQLKSRLRATMKASCESGELARALSEVSPSVPSSSAPVSVSELKAKLRASLQIACDSGALSQALQKKSAPPESAGALKSRLAATLSEACESGALARALDDVLGVAGAPKQAGVAELRAKLAKTLRSHCDSGDLARVLNESSAKASHLKEVKTAVQGALHSAVMSGELARVLSTCASTQDEVEQLRLRLQASLASACESGELIRTLENLKLIGEEEPQVSAVDEAAVEVLKTRLRCIMHESCDSGQLAAALKALNRTDPLVGELKVRLRGVLKSSCESGELARALSEVTKEPEVEKLRNRCKATLQEAATSGQLAEVVNNNLQQRDEDAVETVEQLKEHLRKTLEVGCSSGGLAKAIQETATIAKIEQMQEMEQRKARVRGILHKNCETGELARALAEVPTLRQKENIANLKADVCETLQNALESGELACALSERRLAQPPRADVVQSKEHLRDALVSACESGLLGTALNQVLAEVEPEQSARRENYMELDVSKARLQETLEKSCESGELARVVRQILQEEARFEDVAARVRETLSKSCESGALAESLDAILEQRGSTAMSTDEPSKAEQEEAERLAREEDRRASEEEEELRAKEEGERIAREEAREVERKAIEQSEKQAPCVAFTMKVQNLMYDELLASPALVVAFKTGVKGVIASEAGAGVLPEHVDVALSAGSVVVQATVTPPTSVSVSSTQSVLDSSPSLCEKVVAKVRSVPGIQAISSGVISASYISPPSVTIKEVVKQEPEREVRGHLRETLEKSFESGALVRALSEESPQTATEADGTSPLELARERAREALEKSVAAEDAPAQSGNEADGTSPLELARERARGAFEKWVAAEEAPARSADEAPCDEPLIALRELRGMRNDLSALGQDNHFLRVQLETMCREMATVRAENAELAEQLANYSHGHGH